MYKLMLSDLDETLLVKHHVPEFNVEAIKAARKKGFFQLQGGLII